MTGWEILLEDIELKLQQLQGLPYQSKEDKKSISFFEWFAGVFQRMIKEERPFPLPLSADPYLRHFIVVYVEKYFGEPAVPSWARNAQAET